jgi:hypothetical protein
LRDYWHLMGLCLKESAPLPYVYAQLETWADALDPDVDDRCRVLPGALLDLSPAEATDPAEPIDRARGAFRRRLADTRGVVVTPTNEIAASLLLQERKVTVPVAVTEALDTLRSTWETPNGDEIQQAIDIWRHARELACGFWYRWSPPPPAEWLEARKVWHKFVRGILNRQTPGLDSPLQVARRFAEHPAHRAWLAVRGLYDPDKHKVAEWISDYLLQDAAAWLAEGPGVAWVEHGAVGSRLALMTGLPYFGGGPEASRGILDAKGPIIASIKAHGTGKNLQHYDRAFLLSPPPSADMLEQLFGRLHREGQAADEVVFDLNLGCPEIRDGLAKALSEARYIQTTTGMPQKLLYADRSFSLD